MNLRWLFLDYADPDLKLTKAERRRVRERALNLNHLHGTAFGVKAPVRISRTLLALQIISPSLGFVPLFVWITLGSSHGPWSLALLAAAILLPWIASTWIARYTWRPLVVQALSELGYDVCIKCGYFLRGLDDTVTHCPECGEVREAIVNQEMSHQRASDA